MQSCYLTVRFNAIYGALARLVHRTKDTMLLLSVICCWLIFWFNASIFESECRQLYLQNIHYVLFLKSYQLLLQNANWFQPLNRPFSRSGFFDRISTEKSYIDIHMDIIYYCNYDDICRFTAIRVWDTDKFRSLVFVAQSTFVIAEKRRLTICQWDGCIIYEVYCSVPISVAVRFKACVWRRSLDRTAGSNHAGGMDVRLLWVLCVVG